jgi:hypothetical protein
MDGDDDRRHGDVITDLVVDMAADQKARTYLRQHHCVSSDDPDVNNVIRSSGMQRGRPLPALR